MPCPGGLEDLVLSALVQEQLEGIVPEALALMTPKKMAVSCNNIVVNVSDEHLPLLATVACLLVQIYPDI